MCKWTILYRRIPSEYLQPMSQEGVSGVKKTFKNYSKKTPQKEEKNTKIKHNSENCEKNTQTENLTY